MRTSLIAGIFAAAASQVVAQDVTQSAPFNLVLLSQNSTLNGSTLGACHEGAAIEGICIGGTSQFTFNTTQSSTTSGVLAYELQGGNFNVSQPLALSYNPSSNVALPLFIPGQNPTDVGFDDKDQLYILQNQDDTKPLPNYSSTPLYRWYICQTYYGYLYQTLAWTLGSNPPQNPTCVAVQPVRVFV